METTNQDLLLGRKVTFSTPDGYEFTLREQNGADDDILSDPSSSKDLMNISNFISGLVVSTDATPSRKLSPEEARALPVNTRYAILIQSRIHSIGRTIDFKYDWGKEQGGELEYEVDLEEFLLSSYIQEVEQEELDEKPEAIPVYPNGKNTKDITIMTTSGKVLLFDLLNGLSESAYTGILNPTKNTELVVRKLRLKQPDGSAQIVSSFHLFSVADMIEIRRAVKASDPVFTGNTLIEHPTTGAKAYVNVLGLPNFFYPGEM